MKLLCAWGDAALRRLFQRQPFTRLCHKHDITGQCAPSTQKAFHLKKGQGTGYASSCSASCTVTFPSLRLTHSSQRIFKTKMKNELLPTRANFSRNFQCKKASRWLIKFLFMLVLNNEHGEEQIKTLNTFN